MESFEQRQAMVRENFVTSFMDTLKTNIKGMKVMLEALGDKGIYTVRLHSLIRVYYFMGTGLRSLL